MKKINTQPPAIIVDNITKSFKIPIEASSGLKQRLVNTLKGRKGYKKFTPLKDISFTINKGDFFGIVGRNGSGKSTLLKTIAGIYSPNEGAITVNGKLVPFIELGVGFNPELTGRENIFLNGALLGFSHREMEAMYDGIVDFSELHDFMDERLKNYSSGMQVRLAFSIAIRAEGDILLLDEVLAVGDESFQRKCFSYFAHLKKENKTVVLVTHDMSSVQRFCTKAMLLEDGNILEIGNTATVAQKYQELNRLTESAVKELVKREDTISGLAGNNDKRVRTVLYNQKKRKIRYATPDDKLIFKTEITPDVTINNAFFGLTIRKDNGELVYWFTTEAPNSIIKRFTAHKPTIITLELDNIFGEGDYVVNVSVKSNDRAEEYIVVDEILRFGIIKRGVNGWTLHPGKTVVIEQD